MALRQSLGDEIAGEAFAKWHAQQSKRGSATDQGIFDAHNHGEFIGR